jgi:transcriptional regulator with XRE-family HTH domain
MAPDEFLESRLCAILRQANQFAIICLLLPSLDRESKRRGAGCHTLWDVRHSRLVTTKKSGLLFSFFLRAPLVHVTIPAMIIGDRIRLLRETKKLSQGDIEKRTGLLRCYISRVENGHTVPAIETLEKLARAMEVPLYQLFYDGEEPPALPNLPKRKSADDIAWGSTGKDARYLGRFRRLLGRIEEGDRRLLLYVAQKMANR